MVIEHLHYRLQDDGWMSSKNIHKAKIGSRHFGAEAQSWRRHRRSRCSLLVDRFIPKEDQRRELESLGYFFCLRNVLEGDAESESPLPLAYLN